MATLGELAREHTALDGASLGHLQRLMGAWGMLADLCYADLLLFVPVVDGAGPTKRFVVLGQIRPTTNQTLHPDDLVGWVVDETDRPLVARSWDLGQIVDGETDGRLEPRRIQCIPVRFHGQLVAILTRESALTVGRRTGELERVYLEAFERFAGMIVRGEFPFAVDETSGGDAPRVGDGLILLDGTGRVAYSSPNAVSALHRMGVHSNAEGLRLPDVGIEETVVREAFDSRTPVTEELERRSDVVVLMRCIPLLDNGEVTGGLLLMRDVTDLRRRDRLLLSKDAAIREVHHRVKNNLQTISSLLRLQGRRLEPGEGRTALAEAERRIRSIALVHEILSREAGEQVHFNEIVPPLVRMAEDAMLRERPVHITVEGDAGELPADVATPLAVAITELLQNAAEHAFPETLAESSVPGGHFSVTLQLANDGAALDVRVVDNGVGLPEGFEIERSNRLGLSIVRDLVQSQLAGQIDMRSNGGTRVRLTIPLPSGGDGPDRDGLRR